MQGRTWKSVEKEKSEKIKEYLLKEGGIEEGIKAPYEVWRIRFSDATFTYYNKGTLYSTPSNSQDPAVFNVWKEIDSLVGSMYVLPSKDLLIGLDETGKGEVIGHTVLVGVIFPKEIFKKIDLIVGPADTKKHHEFGYWDLLFKKLDQFRKENLDFNYERIPPWHVDKFNINKIMDVVYQRILATFLRKVSVCNCRIVIDDYGIGATLKRFLKFLEMQGAEVIVTPKADTNYLEVKTASLIAKRIREETIKRINEASEFQIDGLTIGSGNAGDPQTLKWLKEWYKSSKEWPWFVKRSFKTIQEIEGVKKEIKKAIPPIDEEILSKEFLEEFEKGRLSIKSLEVVCPVCGTSSKASTFAIFRENAKGKISGMRCTNCKNFIENADMTLRYYCGYIVPDSSVIRRHLLSNDLESAKFFENFTVVIPSVVRKECDGTKTGKEEFESLAKFASMGRIKVEYDGRVEDVPSDLSSTQRDEMIVNVALKYNAILLTADNSMKLCGLAKGVFTIFI